MKTVGYGTSTKMTKLFDPFLSNMKEYCSYEIAATHESFGHVGMATKIFVLIPHVIRDQCQSSCELDKSFSFRPWEMHVLYNPDGIVKHSVIHRLRLIDSAQFCNKKFQPIR